MFVAVSGNLGGKVRIINDVLSYREQDYHSSTLLHENCIEFEFESKRNYNVALRQSFLVLKLIFIRG